MTELYLSTTQVGDLTPLSGMPLEVLFLNNCENVKDLTPLLNCRQLQRLILPPAPADISFLRQHPSIRRIGYDSATQDVEDFWKAQSSGR